MVAIETRRCDARCMWRRRIVCLGAWAVAVVALVEACVGDSNLGDGGTDASTIGKLGGACYGNGTCDSPLVCAGGLVCIAPPDASGDANGMDATGDALIDSPKDVVSDASSPCSSISIATGGTGATASAGAAGPATGDACYELWAKTATDAGAQGAVLLGGGQNVPGYAQFFMYCYPNLLGIEWNTGQALEVAAACNDGSWHHIAACRQVSDAGGSYQFTLFFDGALIGTHSGGTLNGGAGILTVGGFASYGAEVATVQVDEVRISSTVRYSTTFTPSHRFSTDGTTVSLYHFDEGAGTTSVDSSGNGYTLSLTSDAGTSGVTWQTTCP